MRHGCAHLVRRLALHSEKEAAQIELPPVLLAHSCDTRTIALTVVVRKAIG
jgi:hypothetical protein